MGRSEGTLLAPLKRLDPHATLHNLRSPMHRQPPSAAVQVPFESVGFLHAQVHFVVSGSVRDLVGGFNSRFQSTSSMVSTFIYSALGELT